MTADPAFLMAPADTLTVVPRYGYLPPAEAMATGDMMLRDGLEDAVGDRHRMAGQSPVATSLRHRRQRLSCRRATWLADMPFAPGGPASMEREVRYATPTRAAGAAIAELADARGTPLDPAGTRPGRVTGGLLNVIA